MTFSHGSRHNVKINILLLSSSSSSVLVQDSMMNNYFGHFRSASLAWMITAAENDYIGYIGSQVVLLSL